MTDIAGKFFLRNYTHNLKVVGSNPTPATSDTERSVDPSIRAVFCCTTPCSPSANSPANAPTSSISSLPSTGINVMLSINSRRCIRASV